MKSRFAEVTPTGDDFTHRTPVGAIFSIPGRNPRVLITPAFERGADITGSVGIVEPVEIATRPDRVPVVRPSAGSPGLKSTSAIPLAPRGGTCATGQSVWVRLPPAPPAASATIRRIHRLRENCPCDRRQNRGVPHPTFSDWLNIECGLPVHAPSAARARG